MRVKRGRRGEKRICILGNWKLEIGGCGGWWMDWVSLCSFWVLCFVSVECGVWSVEFGGDGLMG
jgi:hypothetical protein